MSGPPFWTGALSNTSHLNIWAGLHVVSRDFSDEFPCSDIRVIHKISIIKIAGM